MSSVDPNILLVEDDPNDVLLIKRAFRKINFSHSLQVVEDGEEAIAYLAGQSLYVNRERYPLPSLVLLDIKLPRKSGFEVLDWLRKQPALKRLPVVVVTSSRDSIDINRAYDLYANSYLVKPFNFNDWLEMVEALNIYWLTLNEDPDLEF
ncbi:response regulator [candidate division WOR-3 bacterium]|nr:response regulator [candidate division WOR-3 bacterium]